MRRGYAILDCYQYGWLQTRTRLENVDRPVTIWAMEERDAMEFRRLKDARAMLTAIRKNHRRPDRVFIIDPKSRVIV